MVIILLSVSGIYYNFTIETLYTALNIMSDYIYNTIYVFVKDINKIINILFDNID